MKSITKQCIISWGDQLGKTSNETADGKKKTKQQLGEYEKLGKSDEKHNVICAAIADITVIESSEARPTYLPAVAAALGMDHPWSKLHVHEWIPARYG